MKDTFSSRLLPIVTAYAMLAIANLAHAGWADSAQPAVGNTIDPANVDDAAATEYVVNGSFSAGNTGFTSGYSFVASGQESTPGQYGIRTSSQDFNQYYDEFNDHTTGTGNMMLVDGSPEGGSLTVWSETVTVPADTAFAFSAWTTSADPPNAPTLQIAINGVELGTDFNITTTANFENVSRSWNSGSTTTADITIVDTDPEAYEGNGNDFALDDISLMNVVPEPSTWTMLLPSGAVLLAAIRRRRLRAALQ
jgi:hypothetical protein